MINTRNELLKIVEDDIKERGGDEIVLTFITTAEMLTDGRLFHKDQVFENDELIQIFAAVSNLIEVPLHRESYIKAIQSLCANRMKTEYEIHEEKLSFKNEVDTILDAWINGETILRKPKTANDEWQDIRDIEGQSKWDFENYQYKIQPIQQEKAANCDTDMGNIEQKTEDNYTEQKFYDQFIELTARASIVLKEDPKQENKDLGNSLTRFLDMIGYSLPEDSSTSLSDKIEEIREDKADEPQSN